MPHALVFGGTRGLGREAVKPLNSPGDIVSVIGRRQPLMEDVSHSGVEYVLGE
jgi:NAD(P)-dependent dehydrogenase (short-subunit alcohol dehydrogenase family)